MIELSIEKRLHGVQEDMYLRLNTQIKTGEFVAIAGKSGAGKTSLLRILAGLEEAQGNIVVDGTQWLGKGKSLPTQERQIGYVFQDYALFENMSVEQNLLFVNADKALAHHLLEMTELSALKDRLPSHLSGGQKQRVALCRALMNRPKLLLMDEPLSALDMQMRLKLQGDILNLHREFGTTTLMVSHDPAEMYRLSDRVMVLESGEMVQDGTAREVLLQMQGSQKFSLQGELIDLIKADIIYVAVVAIDQQIVEVVLDAKEAQSFQIGQKVQVNTKAFAPTLSS